MEALYTSGEARRKLRVSTSTFKRLVDTGQIRKVTPPGRVQGKYIKEDVDRVAKERQPFTQGKASRARKRAEEKTQVDWMKPSDLSGILKLDYRVYQENMVGDIGLYISWYKKNPQITLLSFDSNNRENVFAYVSLVPLPESVILSILKGDRKELSISPDEVETYERVGGYTLLAESAVTHPDHPEQLNNVLREVLNFWCEKYPDRYIEKIYAQAASDQGDILARKLFFSPLDSISDEAYVLNLKKPGVSRLVKRFQECLRVKKEAQIQNKAITSNPG